MLPKNRLLVLSIAASVMAVLSGCGGSGGGGPRPDADGGSMMPGGGSTTSPPTTIQWRAQALDDLTTVANAVGAIAAAAQARPAPGSITQSSNVDGNNITTDAVDITAEYGSGRPSFSVRNGTAWWIGMGEGNPRRISDTTPPWQGVELSKRSTDSTLYVDAYTDIEAPTTAMTSNCGVGATLTAGQSCSYAGGGNNFTFSVGADGAGCVGGSICGGTGVTINNFSATKNPDGRWQIVSLPPGTSPVGGTGTTMTQDADYLAGGVRLIVPDNASSTADYVFGAFADGSDPFVQNNLVAVEGTATYDGNATGVYSEESGGTTEIGYIHGDVTLTADFGDANGPGTISGSITNFEVDGVPENGTLNLGTAGIGSQDSGFFRGATTGFDDERTYTGQWGGQFYGNGEADGKPGSVAGTFGGHSSDDAVNFVGVFGVHKQ